MAWLSWQSLAGVGWTKWHLVGVAGVGDHEKGRGVARVIVRGVASGITHTTSFSFVTGDSGRLLRTTGGY